MWQVHERNGFVVLLAASSGTLQYWHRCMHFRWGGRFDFIRAMGSSERVSQNHGLQKGALEHTSPRHLCWQWARHRINTCGIKCIQSQSQQNIIARFLYQCVSRCSQHRELFFYIKSDRGFDVACNGQPAAIPQHLVGICVGFKKQQGGHASKRETNVAATSEKTEEIIWNHERESSWCTQRFYGKQFFIDACEEHESWKVVMVDTAGQDQCGCSLSTQTNLPCRDIL